MNFIISPNIAKFNSKKYIAKLTENRHVSWQGGEETEKEPSEWFDPQARV
jgi:hypothetical protein